MTRLSELPTPQLRSRLPVNFGGFPLTENGYGFLRQNMLLIELVTKKLDLLEQLFYPTFVLLCLPITLDICACRHVS